MYGSRNTEEEAFAQLDYFFGAYLMHSFPGAAARTGTIQFLRQLYKVPYL
jgi:hypothetical protein